MSPRSLLPLLALLLSACSPNDAEPALNASPEATQDAPPPSPSVGALAPCELMTPEGITAAAGLGPSTGTPSTSGGAQVCTWQDADGKTAIVQIHPTTERYAESRTAFESLYEGTAEPLAGFGDEAFSITGVTGSIPTATVTARTGGTTLNVQVMGTFADEATLESHALELTQRVLQQL